MTALPLRIAVALSVDTAHIASSALVLAMTLQVPSIPAAAGHSRAYSGAEHLQYENLL